MPVNIDRHLQQLIEFRHWLHSLAEVSGEEYKTAEAVTDFLQETAPDVLHTAVGGTGILATYNGSAEAPHVLIRCELDGLPIADNIEGDYRSQAEGVGHKCGHDGHMAIAAGVAKLLHEKPQSLGKVSLLFQPAEETGKGAQKVIDDPRFQELSPDICFALHNLPGFKKHQIITREHVFAAASVGLIINFKGATAHAAHPEQGRSPALAMAQTVQAFSAVPQFHSSLEEAAKVTVVNAELGERAFGTSPGKATVMATLRTYEQGVLEALKRQCIRIAERTAETYNLSVDYEWVESFPATVNDVGATEIVRKSAEELGYQIHHKKVPFSWSEDFGHFTGAIEGAMFGLGMGEEHPSLHAEQYDFDDEVIATGISMFMQIIEEVTNS